MRTRNYLGRNFRKKRSRDRLDISRRSDLMSKIRSKNTGLEKIFFKQVRRSVKKPFATNVSSIKGKPDLVFPRDNVLVFLDSNFWHGWHYTRWKHLLKNEFWRTKIENNRSRDKKTTLYLRKRGWTVIRVWEHELNRNSEKVILEIKARLNERMKPTKKQIRNKDVVKSRVAHGSAAPRMEGKAKNAGLRSKAKPTQVRKPKKSKE